MKPGDTVIYTPDSLLYGGPMTYHHLDPHGLVICEISNGKDRYPSFEPFHPRELELVKVAA
jgi:hypothetical protein